MAEVDYGLLRLRSAAGRWVLAGTVLGSGTVFIESTVVNVALPAIGNDLDLGMEGLQWIMNGYLLSLASLMLLGGSLGDVHQRRRVYVLGLAGFAAMSSLAALSPNLHVLIASRLLQGAAGALLVPNSLAILDTVFVEEDRGAAIGQWAGWSAVSTAIGPFLGGWLVDAGSWRWAFACVVPVALAAALVAGRHVPDIRAERLPRSLDVLGALLGTVGLGGLVVALVSGPRLGFGSPWIVIAGVGGLVALAAFLVAERRAEQPLLPLSVFRSRQFAGTNLATLLIYSAFTGVFFFLVVQLQNVLGYSALQAGASLVPVNILMLVLSPLAGRLSQRIGPRSLMTGGAVVAAAGMALLSGVRADSGYVETVLPGLAVFGLELATLVAPLTSAVLDAATDEQAGLASAVNNTAARLAGLVATAVLPLAAGVAGLDVVRGGAFAAGYERALWICAGLCTGGGVVAFLTVRRPAFVAVAAHPCPTEGCSQRRPLGGSDRPDDPGRAARGPSHGPGH